MTTARPGKKSVPATRSRAARSAAVAVRPASSPRAELLALHRRIWQENKRRIDSGTQDDTGELARYRGPYTRATSKYREVVTFAKMVDYALGTNRDAIYVGDYHTSKQSQKCYLKLVRRLHEKKQKLVLALELIDSRYQKQIDRFLAGALSESEFLKKIQFEKNWPFGNWENFRPIFDFARETATPILAIDTKIDGADSLTRRDRHAAEILGRSHLSYPKRDRVHVTLIGDLHIAPSHLPNAVDEVILRLGPARTNATGHFCVYQNSEKIYWKLAEQGLERSAEVVQIDDSSFCVMNTPPIILQQTYLNWLERDEEALDYSDARGEFLTLLKRISGFLDVPLPKEAEDVEVYTCGDLSFLDRLRDRRLFAESEIAEIKRQIRSAESYMIPRGKIVYLANLSTNHAAEEASHFLKILCAPEELPKEYVAAFYANALHEAIGFFGSKIINDRRKTPHEAEFEGILKSNDDYGPLARRVAKLVLEHKALERGRIRQNLAAMYSQPVDVFIGVTHALGYMLGEKLFYGMVAGQVRKSRVRDLYFDPFTAPGRARKLYFELLGEVRDVRIPERS